MLMSVELLLGDQPQTAMNHKSTARPTRYHRLLPPAKDNR